MTVSVEVAVPARAALGEGPVWDTGDQALWWADIKGGLIHCTREGGEDRVFNFGEPVGCLARRGAGGLIVAAKSGFWAAPTSLWGRRTTRVRAPWESGPNCATSRPSPARVRTRSR